MNEEADPYWRVGLNSGIAVYELNTQSSGYDSEIVESISFNTCFVCGKMIDPWEIYEHKYCNYCLEVIKSAKGKSYGKCIECGRSFPTSQLYKFKYCPDCAERVRTCECCNKEFIFEDKDSFICPLCVDTLSKACIKCGKDFIPGGSYSYFCPSCYNEYHGSMEVQILENTAHDIKVPKSQNNEGSNEFSSLIDDLNGNDPVKRVLALETLCNMENRGALFTVICALKNKDTNIRWKAAKYLGHSRNKDAVEYLIEALQDEEFIVRNNVVWSLGEIRDKRAIEHLTMVLKDENKYMRCSAAEALEKIVNK